MTEDQKYQGALYKEKPAKGQKQKSVTIADNALQHKQHEAYVEDAPDVDDNKHIPPPAPSPPPATPALPAPTSDKKAANVFDFLDPSTTPTASSNGQMKMVTHAPSVFDAPKQLTQHEHDKENDAEYDVAFEENGFSYGAGPIPPATLYNEVSNVSAELMTPAPSKRDRRRRDRDQPPPSLEHSASSLTGKRKRGQPEGTTRFEDDVSMIDAPVNTTPMLNHSGLTGGLSQMMRMQSPDYRSDENHNHPVSPVKRTRRNKVKENGHAENGLGISVKGGGGIGQKFISLIGGATGISGANGSSNDPSSKALVRTRRHSSSDEGEKARKSAKKKHKDRDGKEKKKHRSGNSTALVHVKDDSDSDTPPRRIKAIEYKRRGDADDRSRSPRSSKHSKKDREREKDRGDKENQVVLYKNSDDSDEEDARREKATAFLALISKGPESERGYSVHKALKKFHKEVATPTGSMERDSKEKEKEKEKGRGRGRTRHRDRGSEEEAELWRMLRLKRNERGEIVVFI